MSTGIHEHLPQGSGSFISKEQLLAYAEGKLSPREEHEVEQQMANDPLLSEAVEGAMVPGAAQGLKLLDASRPGRGAGTITMTLTTVIVVVVISAGAWWMMTTESSHENNTSGADHEQVEQVDANGQEELAATITDEVPTTPEEEVPNLGDAVPEEDTIGSQQLVSEAFRREPAEAGPPVERTQPTQRLEGISVEPGTIRTETPAAPITLPRPSTNRQLHYLHDLKIIHPKELYPAGPKMDLVNHIPASAEDLAALRSQDREQRTIGYLSFMDEALGYFSRNDHRRCLVELRSLLDQYPDDVNALFYAGLSHFHLGHYRKAEAMLQRAAEHADTVFEEEAIWYKARAMENAGDTAAARMEYDRIAAQGGFYAERARQRME